MGQFMTHTICAFPIVETVISDITTIVLSSYSFNWSIEMIGIA